MTRAVLLLAISLNLVSSAVNLYLVMRCRHDRHRLRNACAQLRRWAPCVTIVAALSRRESGAPAWLQAECARVLPHEDIAIEVIQGSPPQVH